MVVDKIVRGYHGRAGTKTYNVGIDRYPTLRSYLWATLYHAYDMRVPVHIPGWSRFERWLGDHGAEHRHDTEDFARWRDRLLGWSVEQDFRCYHLHTKATRLATLPCDKDTYDRLRRPGKPKRWERDE